MKNHVFVRPARIEDKELFVNWTIGTKYNLFDSKVITYPSTYIRCAFNKKGPIIFLPVQRPLMMEALAINPDADKIDVAVALKELTQDTVSQAYANGSGEIYFLCQEESTEKFAEHNGFERLPYSVFRMKLSDLERKDEKTLPASVEKPATLDEG